MSNDNFMPGVTDDEMDDGLDGYVTEDRALELFIAGAQQMREMLARFVEQGGTDIEKKIAISIRANWVPSWGADPGPIKPEEKIANDPWQC